MRIICFLFFLLPSVLIAQFEDQEVLDEEVPALEDNSYQEKGRINTPKHLQNGKPQKYCTGSGGRKKCGFVLNDSILIPLKYRSLESTYSDCIIATEGSYAGAINRQNETVLPFEFSRLRRSKAGSIIGRRGSAWGMISPSAQLLVPFSYYRYQNAFDSYFLFKGIAGNKNTEGAQLIVYAVSEDSVHTLLNGGYEDLSFSRDTNYLIAKVESKYGVIDYQKKVVLDFNYDEITAIEQPYVIAKKAGKKGLVNLQESTLIPFQYDDLDFELGQIIAKDNSLNKKALFDTNGKQLLEFEYDAIFKLNAQAPYFQVKQGQNYGVFDTLGQNILPINYQSVSLLRYPKYTWTKDADNNISCTQTNHSGDFFKVKTHAYGLFQKGKGEIVQPAYTAINILNEQFIQVKKGSSAALIDMNGKELTAFIFQSFHISSTNPEILMAYGRDRKQYFFNVKNQTLSPEGYDLIRDIEPDKRGYFYTKKDGLIAFHAPDGTQITKRSYDNCSLSMAPVKDLKPKKGRYFVVIAMNKDAEGGYRLFAIDNEGKAYPIEQ